MKLFEKWLSQAIVSYMIFYIIPEAEATEKENRDAKENAIQNIKHYEAVDYDVTNIHKQHLDSVNFPNSSVLIKFSAFQRNFCLVLENHKNLFSEGAKFRTLISNNDKASEYDARTAYTGTVEGDPASFVMGHIINGQFDGSFSVFGETFHLEPVQRYVIFSLNTSFHSIIFPASSVQFDFSKIQRKMARFNDLQHRTVQATIKRHRRSESSNFYLNTCAVHIAADHLFFKHVGAYSESATIAEMVYHMGIADKAFRATDFNQDGGPGDGIGFIIAAVTVYNDEIAEGSLASPENTDIMPYLVKWSEIDHDSYCLALLFTYRDFADGSLGLAWVAGPELETFGGICSKRVPSEEDEDRTVSFNTAIASFMNYGVRVPRKASVITVVHEFGHSFGSEVFSIGFGSQHDPDTAQCSPGGQAGNFVMYSRASDGDEANNLLFSPCSKQQIAPVISIKRADCFIAHNNGSYCGNKIVEEGEECDCGSTMECEAVDKCCVARDDALGIPGCTVRPGMQCSHVAGTCCTEDCTFIPESQAHVCQVETDCSLETTCNGHSGRCPEEWKPSNVTCNSGSNTCLDGACIGSICALYGISECQCRSNADEMCHVCCNNSQGACVSASYFLGRAILKRPGSTCKLHSGYCDSFGFCVTVDTDDQLNKLRNAFKRLFSQAAMDSVWAWIKRKWYYVVVIIGAICLIIFLLKVTYRSRTNLLGLARRAVLPYFIRNQRAGHARTHEVSGGEFDEVVGNAPEFVGKNGAVTDIGAESPSRLQSLFPDAPSSTLLSARRHSTSEEVAISRLVAQGYTMNET